jgi:hypothetical protein
MQAIPLNAVPSQTLQITLGGQSCALSFYTKTGYDLTDPTLSTTAAQLYADISYNGVTLTTTAVCLNEKRLLINRQYLGFVGDFMFVDTQGTSDPQYAGLGSRYVLLYLEASDLAAVLQ